MRLSVIKKHIPTNNRTEVKLFLFIFLIQICWAPSSSTQPENLCKTSQMEVSMWRKGLWILHSVLFQSWNLLRLLEQLTTAQTRPYFLDVAVKSSKKVKRKNKSRRTSCIKNRHTYCIKMPLQYWWVVRSRCQTWFFYVWHILTQNHIWVIYLFFKCAAYITNNR